MESDMPSDDGDMSTEDGLDEMGVTLPVSRRWNEDFEKIVLPRNVVAQRGGSALDTENTVTKGMANPFVRSNDGFFGSSESDRMPTAKVSQEIKDLGTKARARLEEEKLKRPEIQLLEEIPFVDPRRTKKTSFSSKIASQGAAAAPVSRKRRILKASSQTINPKARSGAFTIPDVSHIHLPDRDDLSSTVRLHGLPANCAIENVNKFFTGLTPDSVSILLPNHTHIHLLDAMDKSPTEFFDTLESHRVRVVADFPSAAAAVLASERSGETIRMPRSGRQDEHSYVVVVTIMAKQMAAALATLKVPAVPRATFDATLTDLVEKKLHPMVPVILWSVAASRLSKNLLAVDGRIAKACVLLTARDEETLGDISPTSWGSHPGYRRCIEHYNSLVDIQDELLHHTPFPTVDMSSLGILSLEGDPLVHLTTCACKTLADEMDRIEALLYRARTFKNL